ncbi:chorismate synthase, partial [Candidatus Bipolaricaulota bacterium]|nr:chorismate synthase [Candidatus Bipolaricaulota bacterium]
FLTGGESHGPCLTVIVDGLPSGLEIDNAAIDRELTRRQAGHGRGGRMKIERDRVEILGGAIDGRTIGAPLVLQIANQDWENWKEAWEAGELPPVHVPRPGHADWAGMRKHGLDNARPILERASARETAARVAVGTVARLLLRQFGIEIGGTVCSIGRVMAEPDVLRATEPDWHTIWSLAEASSVRCADAGASSRMVMAIDDAATAGESLGGTFCIVATGVPAGLGSHAQWDSRLDGRIAQAMMSIPAIKGVEIGPAFENTRGAGTTVHDAFAAGENGRAIRITNRAGGIEGGMSNGESIVVHAAMKPIPTTVSPQHSVDVRTGEAARTEYQRSDVCAVPAAAVVGEAMLAWVLACAFCEKIGGDSLDEMEAHHRAWSNDG